MIRSIRAVFRLVRMRWSWVAWTRLEVEHGRAQMLEAQLAGAEAVLRTCQADLVAEREHFARNIEAVTSGAREILAVWATVTALERAAGDQTVIQIRIMMPPALPRTFAANPLVAQIAFQQMAAHWQKLIAAVAAEQIAKPQNPDRP